MLVAGISEGISSLEFGDNERSWLILVKQKFCVYVSVHILFVLVHLLFAVIVTWLIVSYISKFSHFLNKIAVYFSFCTKSKVLNVRLLDAGLNFKC